MGSKESDQTDPTVAVRVLNPEGRGPYVLVCDHACNFVPSRFAGLGLQPADMERHIAWDPGALAVAEGLADRLDAILVASTMSRLVIDPNRPLDAPDLIATLSEKTEIPGNAGLDRAARDARIALAYDPYHDAIEKLVSERLTQGQETLMVAIHSFTPVYRGVARPWHVGVIHDDDETLPAPLISALRRRPELTVGVNEPYSPADRVYFTLEKHARSRGLPCVMIEIRNDGIADAAGQERWATILAEALEEARTSAGLRGGNTTKRRGDIA